MRLVPRIAAFMLLFRLAHITLSALKAAGKVTAATTRFRLRSADVLAEANSRDFVDELASVGYTHLSFDDLVGLKSACVTAGFIRELGLNGMSQPSALRALGIDGEYIDRAKERGFHDLTVDHLIRLKATGVL